MITVTPFNRIIRNLLAIDLWLIFFLSLLISFGMLVLYSASGGNDQMFLNRIVQIIIGFIVFLALTQIPPVIYKQLAPYLYVLTIVMLLIVDIFGEISKGAQRWLNLGFIRFQPSEIAKLVVPLMVATFLDKKNIPPSTKDMFTAIILILLPTVLVAMQPDLGTAIFVLASGGFILFLAGLSFRFILFCFSVLALFIPIMWFYLMHDYQKNRVLTLLDPEKDPLGQGYNIIQSKIAIGSGGFEGKGWFAGTQSQLDFLPEPHTDFIFAVLGEEFGFLGALLILVLYLFIVFRCFMLAMKMENSFARLLTSGIALLFFLYVFVNIAMVSGMLPVVGVPLPFVSYGGTSFVTLMAGFGIIMSCFVHLDKIKDKHRANFK